MSAEQNSSKPFWRVGPLEIVVLSAIAVAIYVITTPIFLGTGGPRPSVHLLSNLKQVGQCVYIYLAEYDDRLPFVEPYEFGNDPMSPYLKNESIYENPMLTREGTQRQPRTTQHEFRFAYAPLILEDGKWVRKIVDVTKSPKSDELPIVWSEAKTGNLIDCILFADTHVARLSPDKVRAQTSPGLLGRTDIIGGRLNYVPIGADWPPPTWSLPARQIEASAKRVKP